MPFDVVMPRLGWTMEEGTLVEWLKSPGDVVEAGELLFTVESDKALTEIESLDAGILHLPTNAPSPGDVVPVGGVLGYLLATGEKAPEAVPAPLPGPATTGPAVAGQPSLTATGVAADSEKKPTDAQTESGSAAADAGSASTPAAPRAGTSSKGSEPKISPRARRLARELGVDWEQLTGTGSTGRITEEDVQAAADAVALVPGLGHGEPMSPIRRAIADRLVTSHRDGAPVTLTAELDATALVELREQTRPRPAYNDYLIHFAAIALQRHPALNSSCSGDDIISHASIHIGIAVDTEAGLLVPVVRDANRMSVQEIGRESARLSGRALRAEITGEEMAGGTFTITNLGAAGIDAFTPIINPPQGAILGVGRIAQRPAVHEGQIVPRWLCVVSLTFDHRIIDGGPAARFLATLRELVESPVSN